MLPLLCCGPFFPWGMRTKGAEMTNGVQMVVSMTDKTSRISFREAAHFIVLGVRYIKVLRAVGRKG